MRPLCLAVAGGLLLGGGPTAGAADIRYEPAVETALTYTDNIDLDPAGEAEQALVTTLATLNNLRITGGRIEAAGNADLALDLQAREDSEVELRQDVRAAGTAELAEDRLFVDAFAGWFRTLADAGGAVSGSEVSGEDDQEDVQVYSISPFLQNRFGGLAESELRVGFSQVFTDDEDDGDSRQNDQRLQVSTGDRFTRFSLTGLAQRIDVDSDGDEGSFLQRTALVEGGYAVVRQFSLLAGVGVETIDSDDIEEDTDGPIWNLGFEARPGPRTELSFRAGQRFDTLDVNGDLSYRFTPALELRAQLTTAVTTTQQEILLNQLGLAPNPDDPDSPLLIDTVTGLPVGAADTDLGLRDEVVVARRVNAGLFGSRNRNAWLFALAAETRDSDIEEDETILSAEGAWTRAVTPDIDLTGTVAYRFVSEDFDEASTDQQTIIGELAVTYQLSEGIRLSGSYSRADQFADDPDDEFSENAVTIGAVLSF